jgi:hypothetical protein
LFRFLVLIPFSSFWENLLHCNSVVTVLSQSGASCSLWMFQTRKRSLSFRTLKLITI